VRDKVILHSIKITSSFLSHIVSQTYIHENGRRVVLDWMTLFLFFGDD
jgi:hypothetical protein